MNIKFREIDEKNTDGIAILYIDKSDAQNHVFEEERILWDPTDKGLALAEKSPISIDEKKVVMVDSDKDLLGFYYVDDVEGDHRVLTPYYSPKFNEMPPPAPKRPRSKGHGSSLDKEGLDFFLKNLKEFLV